MEVLVRINQRSPELFMKIYNNSMYIMVSAVRREASWLRFTTCLIRRWSALLDADPSCDYTFNFTAIQLIRSYRQYTFRHVNGAMENLRHCTCPPERT